MNKRRKLIVYFIILVLLVFTIDIISNTYAVFESNATGEADLDIGKWIIKLNTMDISSGDTVNFSLDNFIYSENDHIDDGYIAPGRSGYFDVVLDPTGTDVAIRYDITFDTSNEYAGNISYSVSNDSGDNIRTGENTYSGILSLDSIEDGGVATIRVYVEWLNDSDYDESDTEMGLTNNMDISIPSQISVVQYLGEELVPYVENSEEEIEEE